MIEHHQFPYYTNIKYVMTLNLMVNVFTFGGGGGGLGFLGFGLAGSKISLDTFIYYFIIFNHILIFII